MQFATIKKTLQVVSCFKNMNVTSQSSKMINLDPFTSYQQNFKNYQTFFKVYIYIYISLVDC